MRRNATIPGHSTADDPMVLRLTEGWIRRRRRRAARGRARRSFLVAAGVPARSALARRRLIDTRWRSDG